MKLVRCGDKNGLKQLLLETKTNVWLKPTEDSYALSRVTGQIPLVGGLSVGKIIEQGHFVLGDRLLVRSDLEHKNTLGRVIRISEDIVHSGRSIAWKIQIGTTFCS